MLTKGGRPLRFTAETGESILTLLAAGVPRKEIPKRAGISERTLAYWLSRGRGGDEAFVTWALAFDRQLAANCEAGREDRLAKSRAEASDRWQRFKASREAWWLKQLGPGEFWTRRLNWYLRGSNTEAYNRTVAELKEQGYCVK